MTRVFISYSHKDDRYRAELETHMAMLKREHLVDVWNDHRILAGEELDSTISTALEAADVVLLLVSSDFIQSEYCFGVEMKRALERNAEKSALVVPIIVRPCDWKASVLRGLKAIPEDGLPVVKWPTLDDAFLDVVTKLRSLLNARAQEPAASMVNLGRNDPIPAALGAAVALPKVRSMRSSNLALPREFTDEDRHNFLTSAFDYIVEYFESSVIELQARNPGVTGKLTKLSPIAFTIVVFRNGKRVAGCHIRIGGGFHRDGIAYSGTEQGETNSYNEMLSVETDKHLLHLNSTMAMSREEKRMTEEGAAEHLWTMFIGPLQQR